MTSKLVTSNACNGPKVSYNPPFIYKEQSVLGDANSALLQSKIALLKPPKRSVFSAHLTHTFSWYDLNVLGQCSLCLDSPIVVPTVYI